MQYSWETRISYDKDNDNNMNTDFWADEHPAISAILEFTTVPGFWPVAICKFPNRLTITCHHFVPQNPGSSTRGQDHCTDQAAEPSLEPKSFGRCRPASGLIRWIADLWGWKTKNNGPMEEWGWMRITMDILWINGDQWGYIAIYED